MTSRDIAKQRADSTRTLLASDEPPACVVLRPNGGSPFVLTCDHGGNRIPRALGDLGLGAAERERHIAWDLGAAGLARGLSAALDAPLVMQNYSRLVIDCNRPFENPDSIALRSEDTEIPGNHGLTPDSIEERRREIFAPYHRSLGALLDTRAAAGRDSVLIALHSFTEVFRGESRPWDVSLLYQRDRRLSAALIDLLEDLPGLCVGDNLPYQVGDSHDYGIPVHGEARGLIHGLVEVRQDHLNTDAGRVAWVERLADVLPRAYDRVLLEEST